MKKSFPVSLDEDLIIWAKNYVKDNHPVIRSQSHLLEIALTNLKEKIENGSNK